MGAIGEQAALLQREWRTSPRWAGITRDYSAQDVIRLRGRAPGQHSLARRGARRLWDLLHGQDAVQALGAADGRHPAQLSGDGSQAVYLPGWQAAEGNLAGHTGPGERGPAPVVAGAEAGADGAPDAFELMKTMIEAGAAGVRFDDQLPADGRRVRTGQQVIVPTGQHIKTLTAARLAADVLGVPSLVIARTGARAASLLTSDSDERDHEFLTGERTAEGFHRVEPGLYACGTRALAFAPYADLLWLETPAPDLAAARAFACVIHSQYPGKLLAYSCSPSLSRRAHLDDAAAARFRRQLAGLGYRFQVITQAEVPVVPPRRAEPALEPAGHAAAWR
jgi:isocitrate/methylisocitrate lyase